MNNARGEIIGVLKAIGVMLAVIASSVIAFCTTCEVVTRGAILLADQGAAKGEAGVANRLFYGLFVGVPVGLVVGLFVGYRITRWITRHKDSV
jgi:hypothetical protein